MNEFATLRAIRKGKMVPQTYNSRKDIEIACQAGKIFGFKVHGGFVNLGQSNSYLIPLACLLFVGILLPYLTWIGLLDPTLTAIDKLQFIALFEMPIIVYGLALLVSYLTNVLLVGSMGISVYRRNNSTFLSWQQVRNVEWQGEPKTEIKLATEDGSRDISITDQPFTPIDILPSTSIRGLFEVIDAYFQYAHADRPAALGCPSLPSRSSYHIFPFFHFYISGLPLKGNFQYMSQDHTCAYMRLERIFADLTSTMTVTSC